MQILFKPQVCKKQLSTAFRKPADSPVESETLVHVNSGITIHYSGRTRSDPKLHALNQV
jgi:hypothetical protein